MALTIAHVPAYWPYCVVPLVVSMADWVYRWDRAFRRTSVALIETVPGDIIRLTLQRPTAVCCPAAEAGEFFFVCLPALSPYQWHPLSACGLTSSEEGQLVFMVKSMGEGSWSGDLAALADKSRPTHASPSSIYRMTLGAGDHHHLSGKYQPVLLDGPFGDFTVDLQRSQRLLLVAGGVGMTAVSSLMAKLSALRRSKELCVEYLLVVWVVRDSETILAFADLLQVSQMATSCGHRRDVVIRTTDTCTIHLQALEAELTSDLPIDDPVLSDEPASPAPTVVVETAPAPRPPPKPPARGTVPSGRHTPSPPEEEADVSTSIRSPSSPAPPPPPPPPPPPVRPTSLPPPAIITAGPNTVVARVSQL